jgi:hypothetical protein
MTSADLAEEMFGQSWTCEPDAVAVHRVGLPEDAERVCTLSRIDYSDAFVVEVNSHADRTPLEWARVILEGAPLSFRASAPLVWLALGLKHGSPVSPRFVLGWEIRRDKPTIALLGADSRIGMPAELLVRRQGSRLLFATLIEHQNPAVRAVWAAMTPIHQRVLRQRLEEAGRRRDHGRRSRSAPMLLAIQRTRCKGAES